MVRLEGFLGEEGDQPDQGHGEGVEGKEGEELSVHVDPVDTSVLCHDTARPLPLPLNTYNLGKPDLAKRFQPPADKVIECKPLIIMYVTRISLRGCPVDRLEDTSDIGIFTCPLDLCIRRILSWMKVDLC